MKTNRGILLAFLAIILIGLTACSGSGGDPVTAKVFVNGTAMSANTKTVSSGISFASASIIVGGDDITGQLEPVGTVDPATGEADQNSTVQSGNNNVEFGAEVPVAGTTVTYEVQPRPGFVFDEWEIMRWKLVKEHRDNWRSMIVEIKKAVAGDSQTITIKPEFIQYIRPEFDRGAYVDFEAEEGGDGSSGKPFDSISSAISFIKNETRYDDDEFTLKIRGAHPQEFDLSGLSYESGYWHDDELEVELKVLGGYDYDWNLSGDNRTEITSIKLPSINRGIEMEIELEFRNITFTDFDLSTIFGNINARDNNDMDVELDFRNCIVDTLTGASNQIVNGLVVKKLADNTSNVTFVNSDAPYGAGNTYYHSVIRDWTEGSGSIIGKNNIVVAEAPTGTQNGGGSDNYYNIDFGPEYKKESLINEIYAATPLSEDIKGLDDDILEEDIEGRERYLLDDDDRPIGNIRKVSYGPYEYRPIDD